MIRQYAVVLIAAALVAVFQTTVLSYFTANMQVDMLFVIVVIIGLFKDPVHGSIMSAALGLGEDYLAGTLPGHYMCARLSVFILAQNLKGRLSPDTALSQFMIGLGLGVFDRLMLYVINAIFSQALPFSGKIFAQLLMGLVVNAALVPVFYFLFSLIPGFMEKPRGPRVPG
jgi:rod shape-determining protein MreD